MPRKRLLLRMFVLLGSLLSMSRGPGASATGHTASSANVPILVYHRFGAVVQDAMTVRTATLRWQLSYLKEHGYQPIPLTMLVASRRRPSPDLPPRPIVITVDDGHRSVFSEMWPVVRELGVPVTLFVYPSAISNASYAMTWQQLATLIQSRLVAIGSHTFWHPRFDLERTRRTPEDYRTFVAMQLTKPRAVIKEYLDVDVELIAWPYGIFDQELLQMAAACGYLGGVALGERVASVDDPIMALPRLLVTDSMVGPRFAAVVSAAAP